MKYKSLGQTPLLGDVGFLPAFDTAIRIPGDDHDISPAFRAQDRMLLIMPVFDSFPTEVPQGTSGNDE